MSKILKEPLRFARGDLVDWAPAEYDFDVKTITGWRALYGEGPYMVAAVREEKHDRFSTRVEPPYVTIVPTLTLPADALPPQFAQRWFVKC